MHVVNVRQRSPEWYQWRRGGVTASAAATLTGRNPYETVYQLWAKYMGLIPEPDLSKNPAVQRGIALEGDARKKLEEVLASQGAPDTDPEMLLPVCAEQVKGSIVRASLDGITQAAIPTEIKCPGEKVFREVLNDKDGESTPFRMYWAQVQHQMLVTGATEGLLFFYRSDDEHLLVPVKRDQRFIDAELLPAIHDFWQRVCEGVEPPKDPQRDFYEPSGVELFQWTSISESYKSGYRQLKELEARAAQLKSSMKDDEAAMIEMMGNYLIAQANGVRVNKSYRRGSVDYKAALETLLPAEQRLPKTLEAHRKAGKATTLVTVQDPTAKPAKPAKPAKAATQELAEAEAEEEEWFF